MLSTLELPLRAADSRPDRIVCLDECHCAVPSFSIPHEYTGYHNTSNDEVVWRVKNATIIITGKIQINEETLVQCSPDLRLIAVMAAGYDCVNLTACQERGITVCNIPAASTEAVAEHAIALYFSGRRRVVDLHILTLGGEKWPLAGTLIRRFREVPRTCRSETMGIIGYGTLGKRIETIASALGMSVLIAERKGAPASKVRRGRTSFAETLEKSTALVLCCPFDETTRNVIGEAELQMMDKEALLVNVSRGGVVDETALAKALREGWIAGAATDVFAVEPVDSSSSALLAEGVPNLTLSPHVAWYANSSIRNLQNGVKTNVESFVCGRPVNIVA